MICLDVAQNLRKIKDRVAELSGERNVRLVAVSKYKSKEHVDCAYKEGQRCFGENYVQELVEKAAELPDDIEWHMIGHLQASNVNKLLGVKNLAVIETIDSEKVIKKVNNTLTKMDDRPLLKVFLQVNTSGEESKSGVEPDKLLDFAKFVKNECDKVKIAGLMTIGKLNGDPVVDFTKLVELRKLLAKELGMKEEELELSMGMSGDFEKAIECGSTNVRVGSSIFGSRKTKD